MNRPPPAPLATAPVDLPPHLAGWQLPPGWSWGADSVREEHRHFQEVVDALGRSLSLVSAPDPAHAKWLEAEARELAHRNHPSIPTTYHYWALYRESRRGPGYLRRWIAGETFAARLARLGPEEVPFVLQVLREAGSSLAYLHDSGGVHGALSSSTVWLTPSGRLWLLGWQWAISADDIPDGLVPDPALAPQPPEWPRGTWAPTAASDQWQVAAMCFEALTGEPPPRSDVPPVQLLRADCPQGVAEVLDRALLPDPALRHSSLAAMLRALDRGVSVRPTVVFSDGDLGVPAGTESAEERLRWATGDDYEILAPLGTGTFGSVWRVRDLSLAREVALKMLHPHIASDDLAVSRFRREAQLAAQLAHPSIVPVYDSDSRGGVSWYTMELAEGGSVAELIRRSGGRPLSEIGPQVDQVLDGLVAAHSVGILHRDLKPENILIDRYRRWRISDFGIANVHGEELSGSSGTPPFASPEQLLGEEQGPWSDCFALAAIVHYVITGAPPFGETDGPMILAQQLSGKLDLAGVPAALEAWLRRGLAVDPDARFADAAAMRQEWGRVIATARREERQRGWWRRLVGGG
jgi:serine/threonine protein kinase